MKIAAIICEYMPFHNGHARHIRLTKEAGYDRVICIMDSHVSQRGDFSPFSKRDRALAALKNGADMVVELPTFFACRTADVFARAGVETAFMLGADCLSFGSETADIDTLERAADIKDSPSIKQALKNGESYPRALASAANMPNDILAVEYIRALKGYPSIKPLAIKRTGDYHSDEIAQTASASAIRAALKANDPRAFDAVPENARSQLDNAHINNKSDFIRLAFTRALSKEALIELPDINEGLENLIYASARENDFESAIMSAKCKRYTYARLNRIFTHAALGIDKSLISRHNHIEYIRLIGYNDTLIINEVSKRMKMPFIRNGELSGNEIFTIENRATDLWALACGIKCESEYAFRVIRP